MNKQNFLTLTLIISGLALSPVVAEEVNLNRADMESAPTLKTQQESQSIRSGKQLSYLAKVSKEVFV